MTEDDSWSFTGTLRGVVGAVDLVGPRGDRTHRVFREGWVSGSQGGVWVPVVTESSRGRPLWSSLVHCVCP